MRNRNLVIAAISLGVLAILVLLWAGNAVAGPPMQGPEGGEEGEVTAEGEIEAQAITDDGFWYQGLLTDGDGNPLADTNVTVTFRIYNVSSGGTSLDSTNVVVNTDSNGLFNEEIDFGNPDLFNGQPLWLGLRVSGEASEMTPRQYLRVVPYAMSIRPGAIIRSDSSGAAYDPVLEVVSEYSSTSGDYDALYARSYSTGEGVYGRSQYGTGVYGRRDSGASTTDDAGVYGFSAAASPGVKGHSSGASTTTSYGGYFTASRRALYAKAGSGYDAYFDGTVGIYVRDDIAKGGTCSAALQAGDYGVRKLYAIESPNVWFEDFGQAQLVGGQVTVTIEPTFLATINTEVPYHVFLTPLGDCNGLYVTNKTATSFEVHELGGGTANVAFDYRIVAIRKGYEGVRMEMLTDGEEPLEVGGPAPSEEPEPEEP